MKKLGALIGLLLPLSMYAWHWPWQKEAPKATETTQKGMFCESGQLAINGQCAYMPDMEPVGD